MVQLRHHRHHHNKTKSEVEDRSKDEDLHFIQLFVRSSPFVEIQAS